jgi:hypothetical protein
MQKAYKNELDAFQHTPVYKKKKICFSTYITPEKRCRLLPNCDWEGKKRTRMNLECSNTHDLTKKKFVTPEI